MHTRDLGDQMQCLARAEALVNTWRTSVPTWSAGRGHPFNCIFGPSIHADIGRVFCIFCAIGRE